MKKVKQYDLAIMNEDKEEVINLNNKTNNDVLEAYPIDNNQAPQQPVNNYNNFNNNYYQPQPQNQQAYNQYPNNNGYNNFYPGQPQYQNQTVNNYNNNYYPGYNQPQNTPYNQGMYNNGYQGQQANYAPFNGQPYNPQPQPQFVPNIPNNNQQSTLLNNQNGFNTQKDVKAERDYIVKQALVKNPFLFDDFPENNYINSIEDFFVTYKKEEYRIGDLVRKKDVKKGKKKKIFKENFKNWKQEVEERIEADTLVGAGQFDNSEKTKGDVIKVKFWPFLFSIVPLILACILTSGKLSFLAVSRTPDGGTFLDKIGKFELICYNMIIPIAIGIIMLCIILNVQSSAFGKINKYARNQYKRKLAEIKKKFNKKYNTTYNYYHASYKGNFKKDPLSIRKTAIGTAEFMEVENLVTNTSQRNTVEGKRNGGFKFVRAIVMIFGIVITAITVTDTLLHLVVELIKLITKNK